MGSACSSEGRGLEDEPVQEEDGHETEDRWLLDEIQPCVGLDEAMPAVSREI